MPTKIKSPPTISVSGDILYSYVYENRLLLPTFDFLYQDDSLYYSNEKVSGTALK